MKKLCAQSTAKQATVAKHEGESYKKQAVSHPPSKLAYFIHKSQADSQTRCKKNPPHKNPDPAMGMTQGQDYFITKAKQSSVGKKFLAARYQTPRKAKLSGRKEYSFVVGFNQLERNECTQHRLWRCLGPREARSTADMRDGMTMAEGDGQRSRIRAEDEEPWWEGRGSTIAKKLAKLRLLIWPEGAPLPLPLLSPHLGYFSPRRYATLAFQIHVGVLSFPLMTRWQRRSLVERRKFKPVLGLYHPFSFYAIRYEFFTF